MHECVGAFIVRQDAVLLGRRAADRTSYPEVWDVFGGHMERGEERHEALVRELSEELGIQPTRFQYLETGNVVSPTPGDSIICHFFLVTAWDGTPANRQRHEHSEIRWFQRDEATQLKLASAEYIRIITRSRSRNSYATLTAP